MTLVIMAAGMGSRFGGLKQMESVGLNGEITAEFSVYDAVKAGFERVVFIIKKEMEESFKEHVLNKISKTIDASYVFQNLTDIPQGFSIPEGRVKPWGTGHAVLCCKKTVKEPFAVINADDFYGASSFKDIYNFYSSGQTMDDYCMAGYKLKNTVTENGSVSRGVCKVDDNGFLKEVTEIKRIEKERNEIRYTLDGKVYYPLDADTIVSMNAWGFTPDIFDFLEEGLIKLLSEKTNDLTTELHLPAIVNEANQSGRKRVKVLPSKDMWYGFTYKEDMPSVREAIRQLILSGKYPEKLWTKI